MKHSRLHRAALGPHARLSPPQVVAQNAQIGQLMAVLDYESTPLCYDNHGGDDDDDDGGDDDDGKKNDDDDWWHSDDDEPVDDRRLLF